MLDGHRHGEHAEADSGQPEADPLTAPDLEAEDPVRHDGDQDDPAGEHDLHHGERRHRDGGHVEDPGEAADAHADREPLRAPQSGGAAEGVLDVDRDDGLTAPMLEEVPHVRGDGAEERQQDAELKRHVKSGNGGKRRNWRLRVVPLPSESTRVTLKQPLRKQASEMCPAMFPGQKSGSAPPDMTQKPLLLVDIDGVVSLFGFDPNVRPDGTWCQVDGIAHLLSSRAAEHLLELGQSFEMAWCSGWEEKANEHLPHQLGLPRLPHLRFEDKGPGVKAAYEHWKLASIDAYAGPDRAIAWIDDDLSDECHAWATARPGPTLLVLTDPAVGLDDAAARVLLEWAAELPGAAAA